VNNLEKQKRESNMERIFKLMPLLLFAVPGLLAFVFFVKVNIPWEKVSPVWLMAFLFHVPFLLFIIAAVLMEIVDSMEREDKGLFATNKLKKRLPVFYCPL
jgi:fatty acid desaturase